MRGPASASGGLLPQLPDVLAGEVTKPIDGGELAVRRVDLLAGSELDQIIDHEARRSEQSYPRAVGELPVDAGIGLRPHHAPHPEVRPQELTSRRPLLGRPAQPDDRG